jgi:hypothetical protein
VLTIDDFGHVRDERLHGLVAYWLDRCRGRTMPARRDIDPVDIPWVLPFIWLNDVVSGATPADGLRFRCRLAGEAINAVHRRSVRGLTLEDYVPAEDLPVVIEQYSAVARTPLVLHALGRVYHRTRQYILGERIVLPLSADGGSEAAVLLGATVYTTAGVGAVQPDAVPSDDFVETRTPIEPAC